MIDLWKIYFALEMLHPEILHFSQVLERVFFSGFLLFVGRGHCERSKRERVCLW